MADLTALFAVARDQVTRAVDSAGTTVTIGDFEEGTAADLTKTSTLTNSRTVNAVVTILGEEDVELTPQIKLRAGDLKVLMKHGETLPNEGQDLSVTTCLDSRLVGRHGPVLGSVVDSSNAYTLVFARPALRPRT